MKLLLWLLRIAVFIALFGLSVKNSSTVDLRFFFNQSLIAPLSLVLLLAFVLGVVVGLTTVSAAFVAQRREISALRKQLDGAVSSEKN